MPVMSKPELCGAALMAASLLAGCASPPPGADIGGIGAMVDGGSVIVSGVPSSDNAAGSATPALDVPLVLDLEEALILALENNRALRVQRFTPELRREAEEMAERVFDPVVSGLVSERRVRGETRGDAPAGSGDATRGELELSVTRPPGTRLALELEADRLKRAGDDERNAARLGLTATQPLLRGAGRAANLVEVRQARVDTELSGHELRGITEALAARVETAYIDYLLSGRRVSIVEESLRVAERQIEEIRHRIAVGDLPDSELAAAEAEVALREEALINARSERESLRVRLVRLVQPELLARPRSEVIAREPQAPPDGALEQLEMHLDQAMAGRPDLNQARLLVKRGELELVRTANGLLPRMDVFARLGRTGYADSFADAFSDLGGDAYDVTVGLGFEWPVGGRVARARHRQAGLAREQAEESLRNIEDLAREDVHLAHLEVRRALRQMDATSATRRLQEEKVRAEAAKYAAGESTALIVAQAQRDLLAARVAEAESAANYRKALVDLYRLDGSLLERRGIRAPGAPEGRFQAK